MITMPVLALEKVHQREPSHIAARILALADAGLGVADAVHEALRMKGEHDPYRAQPEERRKPEIQRAEERQREDWCLQEGPDVV